MPLSEHEQRILDQLERALQEDDPRLANTLQGTQKRPFKRYIVAGAGVLLGLVVLLLGVTIQQPIVGVLGFAVMFGSLAWAFAVTPKKTEGDMAAAGNGTTGTGNARAGSANAATPNAKVSTKDRFMNHLEDRWDQRREQQGA
ncbi:MAG: DUF3040 domain-containing protein [Cellulomonadaceae bacterium]|jgi:hypothetical protein|nr:DUF3040 domain-containing protein [Cellulomonadaceae bacterium]